MNLRGFTLVEIIVTIAVIATLIGILLPVLAGARGQGRLAVSLSNTRQLHNAITLYADGSGDLYPAVEEGRFYPTTGFLDDVMLAFPYWQIPNTWTSVIIDILPYGANIGVFVSPGSSRLIDDVAPWPSSYVMSTSFVARPTLWTPGASAEATAKVAMRQGQVRFPSSKALLWDMEAPWRKDEDPANGDGDLLIRTPIAMADGSARVRVPAEATPAQPNPFVHSLDRARLHNTPTGVEGRDYP